MRSAEHHLRNCYEGLNETKYYIKYNDSQEITKYTEVSATHSKKKRTTGGAARETLREGAGTQGEKREATRHSMEY